MEFTGERYVPAEHGEIRAEHVHRYALAVGIAGGKDVLDVACGEGYGSRLLATVASSVVGVDVAEPAIEHARREYADCRNLAFRQGRATALPFPDASFDLVVSFETLEHLEGQREMIAEIRRVLRPKGALLLSSPNRPVYSRPGEPPNPFHVKELDFGELDTLLRERFPAVRYFGQRVAAGSFVQPLEGRGPSFAAFSDDGREVSADWRALGDPVYFVALCAARDSFLPGLQASILQSTDTDLLENYRAMARWARNTAHEIERCRAAFDALHEEHQKVATWAHSLAADLGAARQQLAEARDAYSLTEGENGKVAARARELEGELGRIREALAQAQEASRIAEQAHRDLAQSAEEERRSLAQSAEALRTELAQLRRELEERGEAIRRLSDAHRQDDGRVHSLEIDLAGMRKELARLEGEKAALANELAARAASEARLEARADAYRRSLSWRVTAPLRLGLSAMVAIPRGLRGAFTLCQHAGGALFNRIPIAPATREAVRSFFYARLPWLAEGSPLFEAWKVRRALLAALPAALLRASEGENATLVPPGSARVPRASVIIPVYGQLDYTLQCIRSILDAASAASYEIVVVDDRSPDETGAVLAGLPAITVVRSPANEGFVRACNRGAARARAALLLFLNNDTVVQPDWLDALVRTFEDFPRCGLAGSKLLYPDGRLQEAGGILWNDASGWNYGRLDDPNKPEYSYLRDVDYCSGASLMVRADLFQRLGGFDEAYVPAYCEDSDLAFRVRRAGFRVLYQPMSRVVHFEGVTSGTDPSRGVKAHQVANSRKLAERWSDVLAQHGAPGVDPHVVRDRNIAGRVLVIDHCTPTPDQDAGSITAFNLMRIIASYGMKVTFVPEDNMLQLPRYTADMQRIGIECLYAPYVANLRAHLAQHGHLYDAVVFFRVGNATRHLDALELYCPQAKIVFHTSDLHFLRFERQAEVEGSAKLRADAALLKEKELDTMRRCDATIVHSSVEKEMLDGMLGWKDASRIFVLGWSIPIPGTTKGFAGRDGMVFVGGYQHGPNVDAVDHFVRDIFPKVRAQLPGARFLIVGSRAPERFRAFGVEGVEFLGFVEELGPLLDQCRMSIAPLRYGAGTKGKIYTSLSHGLPCVATTIGAEGMNLVHGEDVLIADDAADFAAQVVRLHEDEALWTELSRNGFKFLEAHASLDVGREVVGAILRHLGLDARERSIVQPTPGAPMPKEVLVTNREEYQRFLHSPLASRERAFEGATIRKHSRAQDEYDLDGWCEVCERPSAFRVDKLWGGKPLEGWAWQPNWRERCVCVGCHLNTRQRVIAARVRDHVRAHASRPMEVYLTEQVTPIYRWLARSVPGARWIGSEYLGPTVAGGSSDAAGIRHEDVERLSFADASFDLVVSNDVLEHVDEPEQALSEILRVLRPGGCLLLTVPFHTDLEESRRRAKVTGSGIVHYLPEVYHGNPVSSDGSLVFTDFGWQFLDRMRALGYADVALHLYWDESRGYYGVGEHYIKAIKAR